MLAVTCARNPACRSRQITAYIVLKHCTAVTHTPATRKDRKVLHIHNANICVRRSSRYTASTGRLFRKIHTS